MFKRTKAYEKLCPRWESFVTTKPVPNKLKKRALIYGLMMVSIELDGHIKEKNHSQVRRAGRASEN